MRTVHNDVITTAANTAADILYSWPIAVDCSGPMPRVDISVSITSNPEALLTVDWFRNGLD